jgi:hypothetical protein
MRPGDLSIVSSSLSYATKQLKHRWDDAEAVWNDQASQHLHEKYIVPIEPQVQSLLKAINRLSQVMARAYEECT